MSSFSVNLNLPSVPEVKNPELYTEALKIYNAIKALAIGLDQYTDNGAIVFDGQLTEIQTVAMIIALRREVTELKEQLLQTVHVINWSQPGEIGSTTPNTVAASSMTADSLALTGKFGANGSAASGKVALPAAATDAATTQALANAMRTLLLTFGLGV